MKYFFPLALTGICLSLVIDFHFLSEEVFYSNLSDKFTYTRIQNMLEFRGKWLWLTSVIAPIGLFVKIVIPALNAKNISQLKDIIGPAILLVTLEDGRNHYIAYFKSEKEGNLILNPSENAKWISDVELEKIWKTRHY